MVWFTMFACLVLELLWFENRKIVLSQQFLHIFLIFKPQYLKNQTCKYSKLYHFLDQFFELFPVVTLILALE